MERPWRGAADRLAPHDLLSMLSYRTQDHYFSLGGTTHNELDSPLSITN